VIDLISKAALEAMQTQKECFWLALARGLDPTTTNTSKTVAKIAKRRIGRPPDGGYEGGVIRVPLNYGMGRSTCPTKRLPRQTAQNQWMRADSTKRLVRFKLKVFRTGHFVVGSPRQKCSPR
jgi:hypothetical protein